jgi:hypothetical protein
MNDTAGMGGVERVGNLCAEIEQGIGGHGAAADAFAKRLPFENFHDEVRAPVVLAHVVDGANRRVIQGRGGTSLALEAFERGWIAHELGG